MTETPLAVAVGEGVLRRRHSRASFNVDDRSRLEESDELGADRLLRGSSRPVDLSAKESGEVDGARVELDGVTTGQKIDEDTLAAGEHDRASR